MDGARAERGAALLRPAVSSPRATFLELFFDLALVFALTRVSQRLVDDVTGRQPGDGLLETLLLFLAVWLVWNLTTWVTSRYEPERTAIQAVVVGTMFGSLVMAVALPRAFEERAVPFVAAYLAVMIGRPLVIAAALRGHPRRQVPLRLAGWAAVGGVPWLAGALGPDELRMPLWLLALTIDYLGLTLGWPLPRLGAARPSGWRIEGEHLAERYQQMFLIALGETILVIGMTYSGPDFDDDRALAFALAFITTALLWRIYFHRAGHLFAEALRAAREPGPLGTSATQTHLFIVAAVLATGVGYELVIDHPFDPLEPVWLLFVVGGPVLFLIARARFEYEIFGRVSRPRVVAVVVLALAVPPLTQAPPMAALALVVVVLSGVAVADVLRGRRRPPERPASPLGRRTSRGGTFPA
ncbi:low temperature requirement protein A [Micromonospora sp. NPDC047707]|uniref:low temperature requirement protein A n=1 Tax=Micromonospora sp. NPDC047707 TaxID=3154498 RepID=UPI003456D1DC